MLDDIIKERMKKRENLEKAGKDVYPASVKRRGRVALVAGHVLSG